MTIGTAEKTNLVKAAVILRAVANKIKKFQTDATRDPPALEDIAFALEQISKKI